MSECQQQPGDQGTVCGPCTGKQVCACAQPSCTGAAGLCWHACRPCSLQEARQRLRHSPHNRPVLLLQWQQPQLQQKVCTLRTHLLPAACRALSSFQQLLQDKGHCLAHPDVLLSAVGTKVLSLPLSLSLAQAPFSTNTLQHTCLRPWQGYSMHAVRTCCLSVGLQGLPASHSMPRSCACLDADCLAVAMLRCRCTTSRLLAPGRKTRAGCSSWMSGGRWTRSGTQHTQHWQR